jgi:hypothetical protein
MDSVSSQGPAKSKRAAEFSSSAFFEHHPCPVYNSSLGAVVFAIASVSRPDDLSCLLVPVATTCLSGVDQALADLDRGQP